MNKKSSVLIGLEEKEKYLVSEIEQSIDKNLKILEDEFNKQKKTLIEEIDQNINREINNHIKNILDEKRLEIRHKTNLKKIELINDLLDSFPKLIDGISAEDYTKFFHRSMEKLTREFIKSEDSVIIRVLSKDTHLVDKKTSKTSLLDDLDPNCLGGYVLEIVNRKIVIDNTLLNRLEKGRRFLQMDLGIMLFNSIPQPVWDDDQIMINLTNK